MRMMSIYLCSREEGGPRGVVNVWCENYFYQGFYTFKVYRFNNIYALGFRKISRYKNIAPERGFFHTLELHKKYQKFGGKRK